MAAEPGAGDPHADAPLAWAGRPLEEADGAVLLLHGRGSTASDILGLSRFLRSESLCFVAPQASGRSWYPRSFLAPHEQNEPHLTSSHRLISSILGGLAEAGFEDERCALVGFSQGACLALDHAARFPRRFGAIAAFTGGLIGPPAHSFEINGDLAGTPVFIGANDPDPHVPWERVSESAEVLGGAGASVELRRYPGEPHSINSDEITRASEVLRQMLERRLS